MGPCAHHRHQQQRKRHQAFELGFFLVTHFAPIHIYQPDDVKHKSFYTEQFLRAGILTQGDLCTEKFFLYTKKDVFTYRCFIQRGACAHKQRHVNIFTHIFSPQRSLCTEQFLHTIVLAPKKINTEKMYTQTAPENTHRFCLHAKT